MYGNLSGRNWPVVDAIQATARGVHLVQHRLRSGWRKCGGSGAWLGGSRGRWNAINGMSSAANMSAASGCHSRRRVMRCESAAARRSWASRSVGVHVRSWRGSRSICIGVRSGRGSRSEACAAG
jgi:hypothetical protein